MNTKTMANGASAHSHSDDLKPLPSVPPNPAAAGSEIPHRMTSTIRTVLSVPSILNGPSSDDRARPARPSFEEDGSSEGSPSARHSASAFSSSLNSNASTLSAISQSALSTNGVDPRPNVNLKQYKSALYLDAPTPIMEAPPRTGSPGGGRSSFEVPQRESSLGVTGRSSGGSAGAAQEHASQGRRPAGPSVVTNTNHSATKTGSHPQHEDGQDIISLSATEAHLSNGWDSTVGKAGLGKTGRVINRLVSDNEALKRDIQIERLKAEESRQAARLIEDKMDRIVAEYESRLLEANVTKTLLSRKERQVESLQAAVEIEKHRAVDAREKERTWREETEKVRSDSKRQVEQATAHAALMEGRYTAISRHWRDQGDEVNKALARMRREVADLLEERSRDDDNISTLRELCDQQDGNIRDLRRQNEEVVRKFAEYKAEQERSLRDIKTKAAEREAEQIRTMEETKEVLNKLKWALNVKANVRGAQ